MARYRRGLPQLSGDPFLTDGGLETTLIFHDGIDLPCFAAIEALKHEKGREALRSYFRTYAALAKEHGLGFVLESCTWRAGPAWGEKLGYTADALAEANHAAIRLLRDVRDEFGTGRSPMAISGCIGPRGDGYSPDDSMTEDEAERYHATQIRTLAETEADLISAFTINRVEEAVGVTRAAAAAEMPAVISFTVETDGKLPTGQALKDAIESVDRATEDGPAYYMINCAHPTHFQDTLADGEPWTRRIRGIRANASALSHAELDEAEHLDIGDPVELGEQYGSLRERFPDLAVFGGCCGTDHRHAEEFCKACAPRP
jgi:S-methylmethionine-dependent homocysteine/selenocysteine methylase